MQDSRFQSFDGKEFRRVLGHYPTGVCAVTAMVADRPIGMIIGSFTAASLDPPLVAFFPDRRSTTWPKIQAAAGFCVNVLAEHQNHVCRALSSRSENKFEGIGFRRSGLGMPIVEGSLAWIDCDLHAIHSAGDHYVVLGRVCSLDARHTDRPLLFFRGDYGHFSPSEAVFA